MVRGKDNLSMAIYREALRVLDRTRILITSLRVLSSEIIVIMDNGEKLINSVIEVKYITESFKTGSLIINAQITLGNNESTEEYIQSYFTEVNEEHSESMHFLIYEDDSFKGASNLLSDIRIAEFGITYSVKSFYEHVMLTSYIKLHPFDSKHPFLVDGLMPTKVKYVRDRLGISDDIKVTGSTIYDCEFPITEIEEHGVTYKMGFTYTEIEVENTLTNIENKHYIVIPYFLKSNRDIYLRQKENWENSLMKTLNMY